MAADYLRTVMFNIYHANVIQNIGQYDRLKTVIFRPLSSSFILRRGRNEKPLGIVLSCTTLLYWLKTLCKCTIALSKHCLS